MSFKKLRIHLTISVKYKIQIVKSLTTDDYCTLVNKDGDFVFFYYRLFLIFLNTKTLTIKIMIVTPPLMATTQIQNSEGLLDRLWSWYM